ncbi:MAG: hypothetical protein WC390_08645 [Sulfurimonas sp.]
MKKIRYKAGYKYQLVEDYLASIAIYPNEHIKTPWIELTAAGLLTIKAGYAWDGPSGPAIDTRNFMRGSLVHDALYQLIREDHLTQVNREDADKTLYLICLEDGMSAFRAECVYETVRVFGRSSASPNHDSTVLEAP